MFPISEPYTDRDLPFAVSRAYLEHLREAQRGRTHRRKAGGQAMEGNLYRQEALVELLHLRGDRSGVTAEQRHMRFRACTILGIERTIRLIESLAAADEGSYTRDDLCLSSVMIMSVLSVSSSTPSTSARNRPFGPERAS